MIRPYAPLGLKVHGHLRIYLKFSKNMNPCQVFSIERVICSDLLIEKATRNTHDGDTMA
jgi:hypothetical protein